MSGGRMRNGQDACEGTPGEAVDSNFVLDGIGTRIGVLLSERH